MKYSIKKEFHYGTYIVYKRYLFGIIKKPIARLHTSDAAMRLVRFIEDPIYNYRLLGCTLNTRQWLKDDLSIIADSLYDII